MQYHRIPVPEFLIVPRGRKARLTKRLTYPVIVKSLTQEASIGISQASVVDDDTKLKERVQFIHDSITTDAIIEQFVVGRELYCGVIGNQRAQVLPVWEMTFAKHARRPASHRHRTREVECEVPEESRHRHGRGEEPSSRRRREGAAHHEARVQSARAERLRTHRSPTRRSGTGTRARSEPPNPQIARSEDFAESAALAGFPIPRCCSGSSQRGYDGNRSGLG
jgi:D-alanine-D-alanine ligase